MKSIKLYRNNPDGSPQHLSDVLPVIPTNTILCKRITGCGATYGELKTARHSIIVEPNKPVIQVKEKDPLHTDDNVFGIYEGVTTDKVISYLERTLGDGKYIKILTTPESFQKVIDAFEELDLGLESMCFILFDECQKLTQDVDYRGYMTLPINVFFRCPNKALVSATPTELSDPRFKKQGFTTLEVVPQFDYRQDITLVTTNNVLIALKHRLRFTSRPVFIFCNSTETIYALMNQLEITKESQVFCSFKSKRKLKNEGFNAVSDTWDPSLIKRYNFMTSRFYNAVDIKLDFQPHIFLFTDCNALDYTMFDPGTDTVQVIGRFRNGVASVTHISNTNQNFPVKTRPEIMAEIKTHKKIYHIMKNRYDYTEPSGERNAYYLTLQSLPYAKWLDLNNKVNYYLIDNYIEDELIRGIYSSPNRLIAAYRQCGMFNVTILPKTYDLDDTDILHRSHLGKSIKEKRKNTVELLVKLDESDEPYDYDLRYEITKIDPFIVETYETLGKEELDNLGYSQKKIREALIIKKYNESKHGKAVEDLVFNSFYAGHWYEASKIKEELKRIFSLLGIKPYRAVTSHTIQDYFEAKEVRTNKGRGYLLISKNG